MAGSMNRDLSVDLTRTITALVGTRLIWSGLRAAKLHHLLAMGLGSYLVMKAFSRPTEEVLVVSLPRSDLGEKPTLEVEQDEVDAASWASFPASDPPSYSPRSAS